MLAFHRFLYRNCLAAFALGTGVLCVLASSPVMAEAPKKIATANLCVDQLVLRIADPDRVTTVHWLTQEEDDSSMAAMASRYPANHGQAEEILATKPELVFLGSYNAPLAGMMMDALGLQVVRVTDPVTYEGIVKNVRQIASTLGREARGAAIVTSFEANLAATHDVLKDRDLRVLVYGSGGYSAGRPGLFDATLTHVGLTNLAAEGDDAGWVPMTVEEVLLAKPDILLLGDYRLDSPSLAGNITRHPALAGISEHVRVIHMPTKLWNCGTPTIAEAAAYLVEQITQAFPESAVR